jgi:hypothetical protein
MSPRHLKTLLVVLLTCTCFSFVPAAAQGQRPRVIQRISLPDEPVEELEVEVGGRAVKLNSVFHAERNWLKGLKVKARNVSGRRIVFAELSLSVPQRGTMEYPLGITITYGQLPALDSPPAPEEKLVAPGQIFKLTLSDQTFDNAMSFLAEHQVTEIVEAKMTGLMIVFDDSTAWNNGNWLRRDLSRPYRWVPAKQDRAALTPGSRVHD